MNATLDYAAITARAEQDMRAHLKLAAKQRAAKAVTSECLARGAAIGILSPWEGIVADLGGLLDGVFKTDRARLSALMDSDAAAPTPR